MGLAAVNAECACTGFPEEVRGNWMVVMRGRDPKRHEPLTTTMRRRKWRPYCTIKCNKCGNSWQSKHEVTYWLPDANPLNPKMEDWRDEWAHT